MIVWRGAPGIMPAIEFDKETLGSILQTRKFLRVPANQRTYAWKKEHVLDLYRDLNGAITKNQEEYFLGAVIVVFSDGSPGIYVYDGQQRLATTMMLIAAIRDYFWNANDRGTAETIAGESLRSVDRRTLAPLTHFQLSVDDDQFFIDSVLLNPNDPARQAARPDPNKESHARIVEAFRQANEHIASITEALPAADKGELLHRWLDFIEKGARVIWVEVADQPTAYRIFETMNDRGLKLSAADLIKNYLYSLVDDARKDHAMQRWRSMSTILESLGREDGDIVDYIRYFWITNHGQTRSNELFDKLKGEVNSEATAIQWLTRLEARANDYAALYTSSHDAWNSYHQETRATIETLRYLGVSQVRPLLLAAYGIFPQVEMEKLLAAAVNWSVRCLLSGVPSGTLEGHYSKNAKAITEGRIRDVAELTNEMSAIIPADGAFQAAVENATVATASLARYYLRRLQMQQDANVEPQYVPNEGRPVTLEHVLPRNPGAGWEHVSAEDAKAYYNRLGNQALLAGSVNSRIGNVDFEAKREALRSSPFALTNSIAESAQWDIDDIEERQRELARLAVEAWPL